MSESFKFPTVPSGYDLPTAQICSFLVNVAINMGNQWKAMVDPEDYFDWGYCDKTSPPRCMVKIDSCTTTMKSQYTVNDFDIGSIIWSTFQYVDKDKNTQKTKEPFGFVATKKDDHTAYLVFRGSQTDADGAIDVFMRDQIAYVGPTASDPTGMMAHHGFLNVFTGLDFESLKKQLKQLEPGTTRLTTTGHSLGSALATLAVPYAISVVGSGIKVQQFNQASPKVGNQAFADYLDKATPEGLGVITWRLVNAEDVVPKIPPGKNYVHVGKAWGFDSNYKADKELKTIANNHNPCCCYSYAIYNSTSYNITNPDFKAPNWEC